MQAPAGETGETDKSVETGETPKIGHTKSHPTRRWFILRPFQSLVALMEFACVSVLHLYLPTGYIAYIVFEPPLFSVSYISNGASLPCLTSAPFP